MENNITLRPSYYGGKDNHFEVRKVIKRWKMGFDDGNALKYIVRAGKKENDYTKDLVKALTYLEFLTSEHHLPIFAPHKDDVNKAVCAWNFTSIDLANAATCLCLGHYTDAKQYVLIELQNATK